MRAGIRMAMASEQVTSTAVMANEFPDLARRYRVQAVPKSVFNDSLEVLGAVPDAVFIENVQRAGRGGVVA